MKITAKTNEDVSYRGEPIRKMERALDREMKKAGFSFVRTTKMGDHQFKKDGKTYSYHIHGQSGDPQYFDYVTVTKGEVGWDKDIERQSFNDIDGAVAWLNTKTSEKRITKKYGAKNEGPGAGYFIKLKNVSVDKVWVDSASQYSILKAKFSADWEANHSYWGGEGSADDFEVAIYLNRSLDEFMDWPGAEEEYAQKGSLFDFVKDTCLDDIKDMLNFDCGREGYTYGGGWTTKIPSDGVFEFDNMQFDPDACTVYQYHDKSYVPVSITSEDMMYGIQDAWDAWNNPENSEDESKKPEGIRKEKKWMLILPSKSSVEEESAVLRDKGIPFHVTGTTIFIKPSDSYDEIIERLYGPLAELTDVDVVEANKSEAKRNYYGYGKDEPIDKEDNDFMFQVAYDWFEKKLLRKLKDYADNAVNKVIDKDMRSYEEIETMDDYYDYLEKYGPDIVEEIKNDNADEAKKSEAEGYKDVFTIELSRIYADGEENGIDDMQAAQTFYDEDEAIKVANELADSYADDDDVVFVVVMAGEREKPNGDIVGEPFDIYWASSSNPAKTAEYRKKAGFAASDGKMDYYAKQTEAKKSDGKPDKDGKDDKGCKGKGCDGSDEKCGGDKKSESLTLKQAELKKMAKYGEAEDITSLSDAEAKELKKSGVELVGISRGVYGMNGALMRGTADGKLYVITSRNSNLFYFV